MGISLWQTVEKKVDREEGEISSDIRNSTHSARGWFAVALRLRQSCVNSLSEPRNFSTLTTRRRHEKRARI